MQFLIEREMNQMDQGEQMNHMDHGKQMNHSQSIPGLHSSEDHLPLSNPSIRPGHDHKLEHDLASLTSAMTDMSVCMQEVSTCNNKITVFTCII